MLKASGRTADGRPVVVLGLTGENVTRLVAGEPMRVDLRAVGVDVRVVVLYGRDNAALTADVQRLLEAVKQATAPAGNGDRD